MSYADIIKKKSKEWNCPELLTSVNSTVGQKIPFSSPMMNFATYGGIPRNKITEFLGEPGGGKTSTAVDVCKNAVEIFKKEYESECAELLKLISSGNKALTAKLADLQDRGAKKVVYFDLEHAFDSAWSIKLGLNSSEIEIPQPPDVPAEELLQMVQDMIETGEIGLIVLDSIPSLVTKAELEKKLGERTVASLAGLMTVFCKKVVPLLTRYDCTLLLINQTRDNMENPYVINSPGGRAIKFYSSLRIYFRLGKPVDFLGNELTQAVEDPAGYIVNAKLLKQKTAPNDRKVGTYYLMTQSGIRPDFDFTQLAITKYGIITKAGAWYTILDPISKLALEEDSKPVKINGLAKVYEFLESHQGYYKKLSTYITNEINGVETESDSANTGDLV